MRAVGNRTNKVTESSLPQMSAWHWNAVAIPAIILIIAAILQIISFNRFRDFLNALGLAGPTVWAICIIIAELWGGVSLSKVRMHKDLRFYGIFFGLLVTGFWFIENLAMVTGAAGGQLPNSGYFGGYLRQTPGWLTVLEITIMLFWMVYSAEVLRWRPTQWAKSRP